MFLELIYSSVYFSDLEKRTVPNVAGFVDLPTTGAQWVLSAHLPLPLLQPTCGRVLTRVCVPGGDTGPAVVPQHGESQTRTSELYRQKDGASEDPRVGPAWPKSSAGGGLDGRSRAAVRGGGGALETFHSKSWGDSMKCVVFTDGGRGRQRSVGLSAG